MPVYKETRTSVRQAVGRSSNMMLGRRTYSVTSGTLALVRAEDIVLRDSDYGRGLYLYVPDGGGSGQSRTVVSASAFVQGTGSILYPHLNFNPAPSTNANLELWSGFEPIVVNGFIDDALRNAATSVLQRKEYIFSMVAGSYAYPLPAANASTTAFTYISGVFAESSVGSGEYNTPILNEYWDVDSDSDTRSIIFQKPYFDPFLVDTRKAKIIGQRSARLPTADTDNLEVDPEYVRLHTMYAMLDAMPWDDMDRSKRDRFARDAEAKLAAITTAVYPDSIQVEVW